MTILYNGNVGIGTTSPGQPLQVNFSETGELGIKVVGTGASSFPTIQIDRPFNYRNSQLLYSTAGVADWYAGTLYNGGVTNNAYSISSDSNLVNSKLVITTAGNVGVGTTGPGARLHLYSTVAGASLNGINVDQYDSTAAVTHSSKFYTQQQGGGIGRTLFFAASNTTGSTQGQFDILVESGATYLASLGSNATGVNNTLGLYNLAGIEKLRLNTSGDTYFNG